MIETATNAIAVIILILAWLLGGAAFFDSEATKYKDVLFGWTLLNVLIIAISLVLMAVWWAGAHVLFNQ